MEIKFTIPDAKLKRVTDAIKGMNPIPEDEDGKPLFTDNAWAKERTRRWIRDQVARHEQKTAQDAIEFNPDDTLVS